jgi:hypothetical protein
MWIKNHPVYFTLPGRIIGGDGNPVTTLVKADFDIELGDPSDTDRVALVTIEHQDAVPGLYGGTFTPDDDGIWRLSIRADAYGVEATQQFEVSGAASYTGGTLTDIASVRVFLGSLSLNYTDAEIQAAIDWACATVETYCNRTFTAADYTETYDGNGQDVLYLRQYPINSVTSITLDDDTLDSDDYTVEDTGIYYEDGWTKDRRNIVVVYNAGYSTIPADLHMVATRLAADLVNMTGQSGTIQSEKIGDYSYTLSAAATGQDNALNAGYRAALAKYRRIVL